MQRRFSSIILVLVMLTTLCSCGKKAPTWQEQYDLGIRFLEDCNYEEAIIAFTAAIEIDPMQPDTYLALANTYIGQNNFDAAREILVKGYDATGDQRLKAKIDEIDSGNIWDYWNNLRKASGFDSGGNLLWYHIYNYDGKQISGMTTYDPFGNKTGFWDGFLYDEEGRVTRYPTYGADDGIVEGYSDFILDANGTSIQEIGYDLSGTILGHTETLYNKNGRPSEVLCYENDGVAYTKDIIEYDEQDRPIKTTHLDSISGSVLQITYYYYDKAGNMERVVIYDGDGNLMYQEEYN